jgi:hypothetical protein
MDEEKEIRKYVFFYFGGRFMSLSEITAYNNFLFLEKAENEKSSRSINENIRKKIIYNSEIEKLMENGFESFQTKIVNRILENHLSEIIINRCPKCQKLTRTPQAKQCSHCFFDWH